MNDDTDGADIAQQFTGYELDDTGLNYAGARYYNAEVGRFTSQDPVFIGMGMDPRTEAVLRDPQLANSYSYARNNPLVLTDDSGEFAQVAIGAGAGIVGQYGFDVYNNIGTNGFSADAFYKNLSSAETYGVRAIQGASIAFTGGAAAGLSTLGQIGVVGTASGVSGILGNAYLGDPITPQSIIADTVIGGASFGILKTAPRVPGRLPNFGTNAFYFGKHTQQSAYQLGFESVSSYLGALFGGGSMQTYTTPSGAVVDFSGNLISESSSNDEEN